jgi:hypothetical protein
MSYRRPDFLTLPSVGFFSAINKTEKERQLAAGRRGGGGERSQIM